MLIAILILGTVVVVSTWASIQKDAALSAAREQYKAKFSADPIVLDPIEDAALMGQQYCVRMELFDLLQKGYVKQKTDKIKLTDISKKSGDISAIQKKMLDELKDESDGMRGGQLLGQSEVSKLAERKVQSKLKEYQAVGMAYPDEAKDTGNTVGCVLILLVGLIVGLGVALGVFGKTSDFSVPFFSIVFGLLVIAHLVIRHKTKEEFSEHTPKAETSLSLMREKWAGKRIKKSSDEAVQHQNLLIFGALGMGALASTGFSSFDQAFPLASASGAASTGCSSCSSCGSCGGGGGGGGGGGCGGGGCGGGCGG
jgi:uncharacterized protein (TIGR04222 family)